MKMKMKNKRIVIVLFIVSIFVSSFGSAYAAANLEPINAFFNRGVSFVLNGELWQPKDSSGKPLAPIIYKGSNYLPVRALAEALKIPIDYDTETQKIYIGNKPGAKTPFFAMPMEFDEAYVLSTKKPSDTLVNNKQYGQVLKIEHVGDVQLTIDRKFKKLVLDVYVPSGEHDVEFKLYNAANNAGNADTTILDMQTVSPGEQKQLTFIVEGLEKIKINVKSHNTNLDINAKILDTSYFDN